MRLGEEVSSLPRSSSRYASKKRRKKFFFASSPVASCGGSAAAGAYSSGDCAHATTGSSKPARPTSIRRTVERAVFKTMLLGSVFMGRSMVDYDAPAVFLSFSRLPPSQEDALSFPPPVARQRAGKLGPWHEQRNSLPAG